MELDIRNGTSYHGVKNCERLRKHYIHSRFCSVPRKLFCDQAFDNPFRVGGEFQVRIDVIRGLSVNIVTLYNLRNNIVRQCSRWVGW
jgi:hypothetical protein